MITLLRREVYYMDINKLKQEVIEYSKQIGIDKIGFTNANPFDELKNRLIRQQELNYQSGFKNWILKKESLRPCCWKSRVPLFPLHWLTLPK
jgi:hypothetical protein